MENKEIVLNELKELYTEGYIFGDIAHFHDTFTYEDTGVNKAYFELSEDEELEVLEDVTHEQVVAANKGDYRIWSDTKYKAHLLDENGNDY